MKNDTDNTVGSDCEQRLVKLCEHWLFQKEGGIGRLEPDDDVTLRQMNLISSLLHRAEKPLVMEAGDGEFDPTFQRVYWYAKWGHDGVPSLGYLEFDEERGDFVLPNGCETVFVTREAVLAYIKANGQGEICHEQTK